MFGWMEGRPIGIVVAAGYAVGAVLMGVIHAENVRNRWPDPDLISVATLASLSVVTAIALHLRRGWARWLGMVLIVGIFVFAFSDMISLGWWSVLLFAAFAQAVWWFYQLPITLEEELAREEEKSDSDDFQMDE